MKVTVIGDGGWGTALALVLHRNGHAVTVWGPFPDYLDQVRETHENLLYLPGVPLPPDITWTTSREEAAADAELVVLAVPTQYFCDVITTFAGLLPRTCAVVSVAKGVDRDSHQVMSRVAEDLLGLPDVAALSGPSHAEEVARGVPTAVVTASPNTDLATFLQTAFSDNRFRVYTTPDVLGVQVGGALKNVIAIAVGVSDGLGFGDNTKAALITRGLAEISRLGRALGASPATFSGLSGMGDLIVTCASGLSRNRAVGERLGRGESIDAILGDMKQVAEGVWNCTSTRALAHEHAVDVPIAEEVYAIINAGKDPAAAVESLLSRDVKPEDD